MVAHESACYQPAFGASLMSAEFAPLRGYVNRLFASSHSHPLHVDSLSCALVRLTEAELDDQPRSPAFDLILGTHRIYLFHDSGDASEPSVSSLIRYLEDEPAVNIGADDHGHRFAFQFPLHLPVLDLCVECVAALPPSHYCCMDLFTGEVSFARLLMHPNSTRTPIVRPECESPLAHSDPPEISSTQTDFTLRDLATPGLDDLVHDAAGIIRGVNSYADAASLAGATTTVTFAQGRHTERCYGRALTPCQALHIARCEAIERFQVAYPPPGRELSYGSYRELAARAIDPAAVFMSTPTPGISISDLPISWTGAWSPAEKHWRQVPAQDIWFRIPEISGEPRIVTCTTSGCSLGTTTAEAAIFAAFELIERDAFLTAWYLARPATLIEPRSTRREATKLLVERFHWAFPGYRLVMVDLTSDIGIPTVGGYAFRTQGEGPCAYVAAATHLDREQAFAKALKDLMGFRPESPKTRDEPLSTVDLRGPAAHFHHFASEAGLAEFAYLQLESAQHVPIDAIGAHAKNSIDFHPGSEVQLDDALQCVATAVSAVGSHLYLADITHPFARARSLSAVRAIAPGLYPLWFGPRAKRFAITDRLRRLAIAYTGSCLRTQSLRLTRHPLS